MKQPPHDRLDPEQVRSRKAIDAALKQQVTEDWAWLLNDERGRRIIGYIIDGCGVSNPSFVAGDPLMTAFNEGVRSIGIKLRSDLGI